MRRSDVVKVAVVVAACCVLACLSFCRCHNDTITLTHSKHACMFLTFCSSFIVVVLCAAGQREQVDELKRSIQESGEGIHRTSGASESGDERPKKHGDAELCRTQ